MQALKKRFIVTVMAVFVLITGIFGIGGMQSQNGYALSSEYKDNNKGDTVYYFSDSNPSFRDLAEGMAWSSFNVIFDVQFLISEQELAYLLYSGYFWGFDQTYNNVAIIEIKTMQPAGSLLENLFACLKAQGCVVMFISPYTNEYGSLSGCDTLMQCNKDKFSLYIKESLSSMSMANGFLRNNTMLLLDGRFAGIDNDLNNCDLSRLYYGTYTMRKILCYMYYGCNANESDFEKQLYENIWSIYKEYVMYEIGYDLDYFNGDTDIDAYIEMWQYLKAYDQDFEEHFRQDYLEEYLKECDECLNSYYSEIALSLADRTIHILAHVSGDLYVDLLNKYDDNGEKYIVGKEYCFPSYEEFLADNLVSEINYLYAMGIWCLKTDLYYLIWDTQIEISLGKCSLYGLPTYIWEEQPIIWGEGPEVISDTMLRDEAGEYDQFEEDELNYMFEELFGLLFGKL